MAKRKSNNGNMTLFIIISGVCVFMLLAFVLIVNLASSAPRVKLDENNTVEYDYIKPSSVSISYEWSETMSGYGNMLEEISGLVYQTASQVAGEQSFYKFTDGHSGGISAIADADENLTEGSQMKAMLENEDDSDLKIYITDMADLYADAGNASAETAKHIFTDDSKALGVISVNSDFNGNVVTSGGSVYSAEKRPFFILVAGENTKVSYFMDCFLGYSKIQDLSDSGDFNCEIFAAKCGIAGIDYLNIKQYNGDEDEKSAAADFERISKSNPALASLDSLNKIRSSVNINAKSSIVRARQDEKLQPKLAYELSREEAVPAKLKLEIPFKTLNGVKISSMIPQINGNISYLNGKKEFVPYEGEAPNITIGLEYNRTNFYSYALELLSNNSTPSDTLIAVERKYKSIVADSTANEYFSESGKADMSEITLMKNNTVDVLKIGSNAEEMKENLSNLLSLSEYSEATTFPLGALVNDNENSVIANIIFSDSSDILENKSEMIKIEYTIDFKYNQNAIPLWVTELSCANYADSASGKVCGLNDYFENLYAYLKNTSDNSCKFTVYVKKK